MNKKIFADFIAFSNLLYFIAGASQEHLKICDNSYFNEYSNLIVENKDLIENFDELICPDYNPEKIIEKLKELGFETKNIEKLTYKDIKKLRSKKSFKKFATYYCKKATHHEALKYLENKKTILDMIPKIIDFTVSLFSSIITFIITTLFQPHNFQLNLLYSIAAFALQYIILLIVNRKNSLALNVFGCFIPTVYLYKLKKHINSL